jgi:Txe/YoeB family toxin of Txe-Axe toxin-antitoxin module
MIKPSRVVFISDELEDNYNSLPEDDFVKKSIVKAVKDLKYNAFAGIHMPKGWRLLYTVTSENEVELISAILEWFDHKEYERRFRY